MTLRNSDLSTTCALLTHMFHFHVPVELTICRLLRFHTLCIIVSMLVYLQRLSSFTLNALAMCFPSFPRPKTPIFMSFNNFSSSICSFIQSMSVFISNLWRLLFSISNTWVKTLSLINLAKLGYAKRQIGTFERLDVSSI